MLKENEVLSVKTREKIDKALLKYPADQKQSAIKTALHAAQEQNNGWLSERLLAAVADYLSMPRIAVYEVASFYTMFNLQPVGKYRIDICTNISCLLCGSKPLVEHLKQRLSIEFGETTADGKFTLREVECLAACGGAPALQINKDYHEGMSVEKIDKLLDSLEADNG